jgi:hypothetical protein
LELCNDFELSLLGSMRRKRCLCEVAVKALPGAVRFTLETSTLKRYLLLVGGNSTGISEMLLGMTLMKHEELLA